MLLLEKLLQFVADLSDRKSGRSQTPKVVCEDFFSEKIRRSFAIAHVSDLHNKLINCTFGSKKPNLIVITGDGGHNQSQLDSYEETYNNFLLNCRRLIEICSTVIYITGNHDYYDQTFLSQLRQDLAKIGVIFLERGDSYLMPSLSLRVTGVSDTSDPQQLRKQLKRDQLVRVRERAKIFQLILFHRPSQKFLEVYKDFPEVDLALSGHAHGGQWRFGFGWSFVAPGQGLFPKNTAGFVKIDKTWIHISRGSAKCFGPRFFNPPIIDLITIKNGDPSQNKETANRGFCLLADKILRDKV